MTAAAHVWVLTTEGSMVRADRIMGLRLRRGSSDDPDAPEESLDRVVDAAVWAMLEPDWRLMQLEVVEPAEAADALAGLIAGLGQADIDSRSAVYVRYERPGWRDGPETPLPGRWTLTDQAPLAEWTTDLLGLPEPTRIDDRLRPDDPHRS